MSREAIISRDSTTNRFLLRNFGDSLLFSGSPATEFVDLPGLDKFSFIQNTGVFTFIGIFKPTSVAPMALFGSTSNNSEKGSTAFVNMSTGVVNLKFCNGSGTAGTIRASNAFPQILGRSGVGKPIFIAISSTVTSGISVDFHVGDFGSQLSKDTKSGAVTLSTGDSTRTMCIGAVNDVAKNTGMRSNVNRWLMFNSALSTAQIENYYYRNILPTGLQGSILLFDDAEGSTPIDTGSFANNGALTGATYTTGRFSELAPRSVASSRSAVM